MSQTNPSPTNGDTTEERTDHERITDVRDLDAGDGILVGDHVKPIVVDDHGIRPVQIFQGEPTQHAVEASGEWANAVSVLLVNRIDMGTGERRGDISVDLGAPEPVWRVSE
ncbi:hypothetical protein D3D02_11770 [Halobellus sp. Atlit-38R]|uniref:hypothetical protein n=1 Tax=Halobellus sp. Atlit-38R TaxID=2282131 RepID=UPI000EF199A1|nr:hypothetical protein [Halobellus sp. Atlit-38R]RLM88665.1 hypothetical protein D3D02_11770 [Halobellus sp. Atlit-38R]